MTLQLDVKYLEGLSGKGDRIIRAKFRGSEKSTQAARGQNACYFGVELVWKVARRLTETDNIVITAYDQSKYLPKKAIGSVTVNLSELIKRQALNLEEFLVDSGKVVTNVSLSFDLYYRPPDQGEEGLDSERFEQPFADFHKASKSGDEFEEEADEAAEEELESENNFAELFDMQAAGTGVDMGDIQSVHSSVLSAPIRRDPKLKPLIDATVLKPETFTVSVTIIEARNLPGTNINPIVTVTANGKTQKTDVKLYTNTPYYNKFFSFEYYMPRPAVMDEIIRIKVFSLRSHVVARILPGKFIGEFLIDVRTIYESKGHALSNKWAVLIDPKNPLQGPVGYVRLDLAFLGKDEIPKHIKREKAAEDENIEKDLLVPKGITNLIKRNLTEFAVKLYRAEGLPPMNTDIITSIKQAFVGEGAPMCDPYVEVSFGGHSGKTKVKKYTYNPIWNQEIVFADFFPPLTHSIRLTVKDWDTLKDEEIATHIIDLKQIFNTSTPNQLPSFGPSWVNLYGTPRTYTYEQMKRPHDELNRNLGEGVAFRGRLLMTIQAKPSMETMKTGAFSKGTPAVSELVAGKKSPYFLFVTLYGVSAIDPEIGRDKSPIQFEVSIGTYGNKIDGRKGGIYVPQSQPPRRDEPREKLDWNESLSTPLDLTTDSGAYYHVEFQGAQPCLYLLCEFEDHRLRMCIPNILEKLRDEYAYAISQVQHLIRRRKQGSARHRFRQILLYKSRLFGEAATAACKCRGTAPKTPLDVSYQVRVRSDLLRIEKRMKIVGKRLTNANMSMALREARAAIARVTDLINCPQHALPDVFISMVRNNQRIGFLRIPARDVYYSVSDAERGKYNSLVTTHSVRKPGHEGVGEKGWRMQCQVQLYMWLGLLKDYRAYKTGLPLGYDEQCVADLTPPRALLYRESSVFELRCYLFMAKNLLASNSTGFSDPIARVLLDNVLLETFVIHDTMSPMWDLTLIRSSVTFNHCPEGVKMNPPHIIVEFFDIDGSEDKSKQGYVKSSGLNYLGRCFCEPQITIKGDNYIPPPLQWWQIYRGQTLGGKLLAGFDLIQSDALEDSPDIPDYDELLDFTRRFNEHILLGPTCGIPFSDDEEDDEEMEIENTEVQTSTRFEDEMAKANQLLDEEAMANLDAPLDDIMSAADTRSVISTTSGATARRVARRKKQQGRTVKYGLATPDLVRWRAETDLRVPEAIRPPLGRFRLEVVFWGVRELRRQFLLPVNRPIITVEVGGTRVVSDLMQNAKVNPLFEHHLKYVDLNLPLDDQYWPPITIMCHDYRMFGVRITVGLCTLPVATDFFEKTALG
uniref:C2 domain-containing protein n=1 Tax=Schistocephalus solidus TaxID=70667 RepID=A0A0X3NX87_SCHSO